jgi:cytochrome c oxidase assembly protein Cox11
VPFYEQICKATGRATSRFPDKVTNTQVDATRTVSRIRRQSEQDAVQFRADAGHQRIPAN